MSIGNELQGDYAMQTVAIITLPIHIESLVLKNEASHHVFPWIYGELSF